MTASVDREIQERRRAEDAAAEANHAKSRFLANMSHELRTPMNAILGYSEMLIEDAKAMEQDDFVADLQKIHGAGQHLLGLINDVLDLSKVEAGQTDLYLESFDLSGLLDDVVHTVDALVVKNGNRLELVREPELGSMHADLTKLRQVLFNLVSNAAKFTRDGTVTLRARRERRDAAEWLHFSVSDTGIGIAEDQLELIFEEFAQADASTTREYGGTGLGLAITRRFCEMMGGSVDAESTLGVGTTFHVRLPSVVVDPDAPSPSTDRSTGSPVPAPGSCVLVIDDDPTARELMVRALSRDGFEVATASGGDEGLELARRLQPAAITLDVLMPGKDGWAVLRELKADPVLQSIPVIMVSMIEDHGLGYTLGADEYLTKPIDRTALSRVLGKYRCDEPPCRVLVVEDEAHIRELMTRVLEKEGWSVSTAENGRVALERVGEALPELIFLDLMMPVMDGFEFLREFRSVEEWRGIPVIVVTAKDLDDEDRRRLEGNVDSVLQKGAHDREELAEEIRRLVVTCSR
jgi:CheY-like chemotaxis protein/nitrogen-specific signal transduction histidine kinase